MRLLVTSLAILFSYIPAMIYGCGSTEKTCDPDQASAIDLVKRRQKQEGIYTCRRVWPQSHE